MSASDRLLENAQRFAEAFDEESVAKRPAPQVAVVACMDARLSPNRLLGLREGDAHVIRNAGGVVTEDVIRSLTISQRLLGTREVILIHHSECGMLTFTDDQVKEQILEDTGLRPTFALEAFPDVDEDVRQSIRRIQASPFIPVKDSIRGFVYEVDKGTLREVT
ncbi:MAG: beta-class carbonic anhydrase [Acidimicrobiia bacterium]